MKLAKKNENFYKTWKSRKNYGHWSKLLIFREKKCHVFSFAKTENCP